MTVIIYTGISSHSCKLHTICEVLKVKVLAIVAKSKSNLLATWEFFWHLAMWGIDSAIAQVHVWS